MHVSPRSDVYSAREIALAAGAAEADVAALVGRHAHVPYVEALSIARGLQRQGRAMFARSGPSTPSGVPLAVSSTLHLGLIAAAMLVTSWVGVQSATSAGTEDRTELARLVFLAGPGPGGGGGGGGFLQKARAAKALREGHGPVGRPLAPSNPPQATAAPLDAEPLPVVVAPIVAAPADSRNHVGVLLAAAPEGESRGSGRGGGAGSGAGSGLGEGDGSGTGHGSGGGIGGGPYRAGNGIEPPRILHEVKADYPEDARLRGITGSVVLEIVVLRDGSVGEVKVLEGLDAGLSERAVEAVRQWKFAAARRLGTPVDVIVEVFVEFKLR